MQVRARFQEMRRERMTKCMHSAGFGNAGTRFGFMEDAVRGDAGNRSGPLVIGEESGDAAVPAPIGPQIQ